MIDAAMTRPGAWSRAAQWLTRPAWFGLTRGELLLYAVILIAAAVLRFYDLGARTYHHDESIHARESFDIINGKQFAYDPAYHGPFLFFTNAALFQLFGPTDVVARILPAVFGVAAVAAIALFRLELGRIGTPLAMSALTVSTAFLYYSRFVRNDIYVAFFTLLVAAAIIRFAANPRSAWIYVAWTALAFSFVTKENTFIHGVLVLAVLAVFVTIAMSARASARVRAWAPAGPIAAGVGALPRHTPHLIYGLLVFALIVLLFFTSFFTNLTGFHDAFVESVRYWLDVHESERVNQPWFYYPMFLLVYEPLSLLLGAFALIRVGVARNPLPVMLAVWAVIGAAVYSLAGEKAPWLVLHVLWPFTLLASWYVGQFVESHRALVPRLAMAVIVVGLSAWTVRYALPTVYERGDVPVDFVIYVQSSPDVREAVDVIEEAGRRSGDGLNIRAVVDNDFAWPLAWYLRGYTNVLFTKELTDAEARQAAIVLMSPEDADRFGALLPDHVGREMDFRIWFPEFGYKDWELGFLGEFLADAEARQKFWDWLVLRNEPPEPIGSLRFVMYVHTDLLRAGDLGPFTP